MVSQHGDADYINGYLSRKQVHIQVRLRSVTVRTRDHVNMIRRQGTDDWLHWMDEISCAVRVRRSLAITDYRKRFRRSAVSYTLRCSAADSRVTDCMEWTSADVDVDNLELDAEVSRPCTEQRLSTSFCSLLRGVIYGCGCWG